MNLATFQRRFDSIIGGLYGPNRRMSWPEPDAIPVVIDILEDTGAGVHHRYHDIADLYLFFMENGELRLGVKIGDPC